MMSVRISFKPISRLLLSGLPLSLMACGPSNQELAATLIAQTAVASELETVAVAGALADALTANAPAEPFFTSTASVTPEGVADANTPQPTTIISYGEVEVVVSTAAVREGPGQEYTNILNAGIGTRLPVIGKNEAGDWLAVILFDGEIGWILRRQVVVVGELAEAAVLLTPTLAPPVKITVINKLSFTAVLRIVEIERTMAVLPGQTETLLIRAGVYTIETLGINPATFEWIIACPIRVFVVVKDFIWSPGSDTFCEIFL